MEIRMVKMKIRRVKMKIRRSRVKMKIRMGVERLGGMGTAKNLRSQTIIKEEEEIYALYYILYGVVRVYRMRRRRRVKMKKEDGENEDKDGVERLGGMGTAKN